MMRNLSERVKAASHELRTPLTTATMMVDLIREGGPEEELQEYWEILGVEMRRQRELIEDLLTVGRLESGNFQLKPTPLNLATVFETVSSAVAPLAQLKEIKIEWHIYPEIPPVCGNVSGLRQVFINLLNNAVKFSPAGETITVWAVPAENGVLVQVADNGMGISAADLPHLFSRFFRARNAIHHEVPGSGVGLYIVKSVIEALGGKISVNSVVDTGTTFVVWLPLSDPEMYKELETLEELAVGMM